MRQLTLGCLAIALICPSCVLNAQQQHSTSTAPTGTDPTRNNPDVPKQQPSTDNPDIAPEHQPAPGGTGSTSTTAKSKHRRKSSNTKSASSSTSN